MLASCELLIKVVNASIGRMMRIEKLSSGEMLWRSEGLFRHMVPSSTFKAKDLLMASLEEEKVKGRTKRRIKIFGGYMATPIIELNRLVLYGRTRRPLGPASLSTHAGMGAVVSLLCLRWARLYRRAARG